MMGYDYQQTVDDLSSTMIEYDYSPQEAYERFIRSQNRVADSVDRPSLPMYNPYLPFRTSSSSVPAESATPTKNEPSAKTADEAPCAVIESDVSTGKPLNCRSPVLSCTICGSSAILLWGCGARNRVCIYCSEFLSSYLMVQPSYPLSYFIPLEIHENA